MKKLLLLSNSRNSGEPYLNWPKGYLLDFIRENGIKTALFFPYAGVNVVTGGLFQSYTAYQEKVQGAFQPFGVEINSIHTSTNFKKTIEEAESLIVGGGNTFHLFFEMHKGLMELVREKVLAGTPFIGWSAGSNIACPSLMTTNDMPIVFPGSFDGLNVIPFQINPHYIDSHPQGFGGETRQQRLEEFLVVNQNMPVVGLREGTLLKITGDKIELMGESSLVYLAYNREPVEFQPGADIQFLLK